tara:strand:- start:196 stop:534 length:339 start_codon:yes stop_codon:yes gene_type:complete
MSIDIILIGLCCLLLSVSILLGWKLYQFSIIIIDIEDAIEESLDILNQKYGKMNEILQKPIFFDSIEIRQVIADIRDCHETILVIANKLTKKIGTESGKTEKEDDKKIEIKN